MFRGPCRGDAGVLVVADHRNTAEPEVLSHQFEVGDVAVECGGRGVRERMGIPAMSWVVENHDVPLGESGQRREQPALERDEDRVTACALPSKLEESSAAADSSADREVRRTVRRRCNRDWWRNWSRRYRGGNRRLTRA